MKDLKQRIESKAHTGLISDVFKNEDGAIDLASIMVGIIVIGLIGGVIAATVFAVIPWTQDNAAKQQLDSVVAAQSAYMGLASSVPPGTPAGHAPNSYADSTKLEEAKLLGKGASYCTTITDAGKGYVAFSKSPAGTIWSVSDKNTKPVIHTGTLPTDCKFIQNAFSSTPVYIDPTPTLTTLTYRCDTTTTGVIPLHTNLTGKETWNDGVTNTYAGATSATPRTLDAGVTYTVTFDGTYSGFAGNFSGNAMNFHMGCLRAVNHWGSEVGITNATNAFYIAEKLTDVPKNIPTTITNMGNMFNRAVVFNDPDVNEWNVANVTNMNQMFIDATAFNQPLNNWNTANVTNMSYMFNNAKAFNQSLESWDTSKVTLLTGMFAGTTAFNQPLDGWNTTNVTSLKGMFNGAKAFNQPIGSWDVRNVTDISQMFQGASKFNQPLNTWTTTNFTRMEMAFLSASTFNQPLSNWNTSKVEATHFMFSNAVAFNQPLNTWNMSNVTNMAYMFEVTTFNQPLNNWTTTKVTNMSGMFYSNTAFVQNLSTWNTTALTNGTSFAPASSFPSTYKPTGTTLY